MSKKLPKILRRDLLVLKAEQLDQGVALYYEDMRPVIRNLK